MKILRALGPVLGILLGVGAPFAAHAAPRDTAPAAADAQGQPYRSHFGHTDVYIPASLHAEGGTYDLVVHFHGLSRAQESNTDVSKLNAVVASVNLGVGTDPYEQAFASPRSFDLLVQNIERQVERSGRVPGARLGRIALSAWSAGVGAVGAILRVPANYARVDAVLVADGLHARLTDDKRRVVDDRSIARYTALAETAMRGEKLFSVTHSAITTTAYASTTEAAQAMLRVLSVPKETPSSAPAPRNMRPVYQVNRGAFHVVGFEGRGVTDHIDQIWAMGDTMFAGLAQRWSTGGSLVASRL